MVALGPTLNRDLSIKRLMDSGTCCGPWFYSIPNTFCIYSNLKANDLFKTLHNPHDANENLMVTEVPSHNSLGWLPRQHCNFINDNSVVHDYKLQFNGYWIDDKRHFLPHSSGIYCVYTCAPSQNNTLKLIDLLYIGKAVDIHDRHISHEKHDDWQKRVGFGQTLCYSYAILSKNSLSICESAMIYRHQPICNELNKGSFPHSRTHIQTFGENVFLSPDFTIDHTEG